MYVTAFVKSFAVVPLVCVVAPTLTLDKAEFVNEATNAVTLVPKGTVIAIFVPVITPVAEGEEKLKAVISFAVLAGVTVTVTV